MSAKTSTGTQIEEHPGGGELDLGVPTLNTTNGVRRAIKGVEKLPQKNLKENVGTSAGEAFNERMGKCMNFRKDYYVFKNLLPLDEVSTARGFNYDSTYLDTHREVNPHIWDLIEKKVFRDFKDMETQTGQIIPSGQGVEPELKDKEHDACKSRTLMQSWESGSSSM